VAIFYQELGTQNSKLRTESWRRLFKITPLHGPHGKHLLPLLWMQVYRSIVMQIKQTTENNGEHSTPSTTYVSIEGTHTIAAE
jgi:hypothetical protein